MKLPRPLLRVAEKLGPIRERVVFVGGMIRGVLITDPAAGPDRPTDDVDVIVDLHNQSDLAALGNDLRTQGFRNCTDEGAPICRWVVDDIKADVMPIDPALLGFSNVWYDGAMEASRSIATAAGEVRVLDAPHFIASKLESYSSRGGGDIYHHDLEDIIAVVDGRQELLGELAASESELRVFVAQTIATFLQSAAFREGLRGHLEGDEVSGRRLPLLLARLEQIAKLTEAPPEHTRFGIRPRGRRIGGRTPSAPRPAPVAMESVVSSNVARIGYDADSRVLTVEFRNGSRYEYENVPATEYAGFLGAWSKGRYLHRWIKGRYDYRKL